MKYENILNEFKTGKAMHDRIIQTHGKHENNLINAIYYLIKGSFILENVLTTIIKHNKLMASLKEAEEENKEIDVKEALKSAPAICSIPITSFVPPSAVISYYKMSNECLTKCNIEDWEIEYVNSFKEYIEKTYKTILDFINVDKNIETLTVSQYGYRMTFSQIINYLIEIIKRFNNNIPI